MPKTRILVFLLGFLFITVGVEFALIYVFDLDATILQSLKYIFPVAIATSLLLTLIPNRKQKSKRKKRRRKANENE